MEKLICPKCHKAYSGAPAISRIDNSTLICPRCGMKEALDTICISQSEKNRILSKVEENNFDQQAKNK